MNPVKKARKITNSLLAWAVAPYLGSCVWHARPAIFLPFAALEVG